MKSIVAISSILTITLQLSAMNVDQIMDKMEENENPKTSRSKIVQNVYKSNGHNTTSKLVSHSADEGEKGLMEYVEPARIKGMKVLMLNDGSDIWFYSPRTARVRKIASHQKKQSVNNSDFSYEDMSTKDTREDYDVTLLGNEKHNNIDCYILQGIPKENSDVSYSKTITWVDKDKFLPVEVHFYDENGELWKKLIVHNPKKVGKYWTYERVVMHNILKGSRTEMAIESIENDIEIDRAMFSERELRK